MRVLLSSTRPRRAVGEKAPGGFFLKGGFPGAAFGVRDRSLGQRLVTSFMPGSATFLPHLMTRSQALRHGRHFWRLAVIRHHHVPGRTARRTWLRVQLPAGLRCGYVGLFVGRRRRAANLLVISMATSGVPVRRRRETPDLCVTNHGVGPADGARASSRQIVASPFFKDVCAHWSGSRLARCLDG